MRVTTWAQRFLATTRGRVLSLLRRRSRTVNELAAELDLTDNAVRAHLATLERDGLVRQTETRRGRRRPHQAYGLSAEAEQLFPKAYEPVLAALLGVLESRMTAEQLEETLRQTGRRLAAPYLTASAHAEGEARLRQAVEVLTELGGVLEVDRTGDAAILRGAGCPLSGIVGEHPAACALAAALLAELTGVPVREECDRSAAPSCRFVVDLSLETQAEPGAAKQ